MGNRTENWIREIHRRTRQKQRQREKGILSVLAAVSVFLFTDIYILCGRMEERGVVSVIGTSGSVLLRDGTSAYVVTAVAAFCLGVIVTTFCIQYKEHKNRAENAERQK